MIFKRWKKIEEDFQLSGDEKYDLQRLPSICDNIKYDLIHIPQF
jgi:hypothetical protein